MDVGDHHTQASGSSTGNPGPQDELFDLLQHPLRRRILSTLAGTASNAEFSIEDFATDDVRPERELVALYHVHLPKLVSSGYVEWSHQAETISAGSNFDAVAPAVKLLTESNDHLPGTWA